MPLQTDFDDWFIMAATYKLRGEIRKRYAIRSSEFFDGTPEQWTSMMNRLPDRLGTTKGPEYEVIEGCLKNLKDRLEDHENISEIIFERGEKSYFVLDNTKVLYPSDKNTVIFINLDKLIQHAYLTEEQQEIKKKEKARWKILEAGAVFATLAAMMTYIGDKI